MVKNEIFKAFSFFKVFKEKSFGKNLALIIFYIKENFVLYF